MQHNPDHPYTDRRDRYRLYIDESGDHTYKCLESPSHRYLALLGVWLRTDDYLAFADGLDRFKRDVFGPRPDDPIILHRTDIINKRGPFGLLCRPEVRSRFDAGLLDLIAGTRFQMVCVIIDKAMHSNKYSSPFHPYHYCLAAMLDRYSGWLNYKNAIGDVMAESRRGEEDLQLEQAYRNVYESGTKWYDHEHHQRALSTKDLKVKPKTANIAGLQLADVLAHPIKQTMLVERQLVPDMKGSFRNRIYEVAGKKFNVNCETGEVDGHGKVWLLK